MRVGIYIADFNPDVGGGYTFQDEVFRAFIGIAETSSHQFFVLSNSNNNLYLKLVQKHPKIKFIRVPYAILDQYIQSLSTYSPLFKRIVRRIGPVERNARKYGLGCIWYIGGGVYEITDTPYIATVWDIQHRITPWFPEMSANGRWYSRELEFRYFLQRASYIITGTEIGLNEIQLCYSIPPDRIRIIPHPTPSFALELLEKTSTSIISRLGLKNDYLLYPAQFWPHKNHINLLHSLKYLNSSYGLTLPLVLTGSNKGNFAYLKKKSMELGLSKQVIFTGFINQRDLIELYQNATIMVYASLCGPENLPPLEAFALGCPVLAAEIPGAHEQLNGAAVFFKPTDPVDIAENIYKVYTDNSLREILQKKGLARATKWTSKEFSRSMMKIFDEFSAIRRCWPEGTSY